MPCCGALTFHISAAKWDFWGVINKVVVYFSTFGNIRFFCRKLYQKLLPSSFFLYKWPSCSSIFFDWPLLKARTNSSSFENDKRNVWLRLCYLCLKKKTTYLETANDKLPLAELPILCTSLLGTIICYNYLVEVQSKEYFLCTLLSRALIKDNRFNDFISKVWQLWTYLAYAM